mmetsp:Transcript_22997/g.52736  ORF Transcript_22997/g.52736 Transcript_22997/m.52736 type:complete len:247 (+) Transcript_22997:72-812(+)
MKAHCGNEALFSKMLASPEIKALWELQVTTPSATTRTTGSEPLGNSFLNFVDQDDVPGSRKRSSSAPHNAAVQPGLSESVARQERPSQLPAYVSPTMQGSMQQSESKHLGAQGKLTTYYILEKGVTTLMLHGLPRWLTQWSLVEAMNTDGFQGTFDFVHVPYSIDRGCGSGYGFINFKSTAAAAALCQKWQENAWSGQEFPMHFSVAEQQGFSACVTTKAMSKWRRIRDARLVPFICPSALPDARS